MIKNKPASIILFLSIPLSVLITVASGVGLLTPHFYAAETANWQAQSMGQDMIDLFLVMPCLLITSVLAGKNNQRAFQVWGGVALYLTYTFVLYSFNVHFNRIFIFYCICLGLSFYSFLYFLFKQMQEGRNDYAGNKSVLTAVGFYFIIISILFYVLWLSEIVPAVLSNVIPQSITEAGLFTNGVHVLDLAVILPAIFIIGVFLLKRKPLGFILTPPLLTFSVLMDITIGFLVVVMNKSGFETNTGLTLIMGILALISLLLLIWYLKSSARIL